MCGRYYLDPTDKFETRFKTTNALKDHSVRENVTPGQLCPVIINQDGNRVETYKWGFRPSFLKPNVKMKPINARAETLESKGLFRDSFLNRRCLIPASGFYEWPKDTHKSVYFSSPSHRLFAFAGIYVDETYLIITTSPNQTVAPYHDRMPVILKSEDETDWLDRTTSPDLLQRVLTYKKEPLSVRE